MKRSPPARLWVLLARREPVGVIFRRDPAKPVLLIKWNTRTDSFEHGQWFKGRVYERRCDLSPGGDLLTIARMTGSYTSRCTRRRNSIPISGRARSRSSEANSRPSGTIGGTWSLRRVAVSSAIA